MKITAFVVLSLLLLAGHLRAVEPVETLVGGDTWRFSVRPEVKLTSISGEAAGLAGIQMGPMLSRTFYTGLGYYTLISNVESGQAGYDSLKAFDLWYAGLTLDYTFFSTKLVHGSVGALFGGGHVSAGLSAGGSENANLFVADPGVNLLVNVTKTMELGIGASYRFMQGSDIPGFSNSDLSGPTASLFVRWNEW